MTVNILLAMFMAMCLSLLYYSVSPALTAYSIIQNSGTITGTDDRKWNLDFQVEGYTQQNEVPWMYGRAQW